jgi:hypothetical protein
MNLKVIVQIRKGILMDLMARVLARAMFHQLVLSVVFNVAELAGIWLVVRVSSLMIFAIPNSSELFLAKIALIRLFTSVSSHMNQEVSFFSEDFTTTIFNTLKEIVAAVCTFDMQI